MGPSGPTGPAGGASSTYTIRAASADAAGLTTVTCNPGERATGGGYTQQSPGQIVQINAPFVSGTGTQPNSWQVFFPTASSGRTVWVVCVSP